MNTPLNGLKILDFSALLPGPFATMYLADLGAEVFHIESKARPDTVRQMPPFDDEGQSYIFNYLNRNKQSICLDLKQQSSIDQIYGKILDIDIVVEQFRPGVMQRLGLGYEQLKQINPRMIYCSITGYGQTGPYKDKAGHDLNYMSLSGIAGHSGRFDQGPAALGIQVADVAGGSMHAVVAILAAVIERQKSGLGQYIDISMTDCAVALNNMAATAALHGVEQRPEHNFFNGGTFYDYYCCQDGRYLSVASIEPKFLVGLAGLLELPNLISKAASLRALDQQAAKKMLQEKFLEKTFAEWQVLFAAHDVCVEPVLNLDEALHSSLAEARKWLVNVPNPDDHSMELQLACPIKFSRSTLRYDFKGQKLGSGQW